MWASSCLFRRPAVDNNQHLASLARAMNDLVFIGTVLAVDASKSLCRIGNSANETGWIPWLTQRSEETLTFCAPAVGEQVLALCANGQLAQAVVIGALAKGTGGESGVYSTTYSDGTSVRYDANTSELAVNCKGKVKLVASAEVEVHAPSIKLGEGVSLNDGVITGQSICHFTGNPHKDCSTRVLAKKA